MKNRTTMFTVLLAFLAAFTFTTPVLAAPPEEDATGTSDGAGETGDAPEADLPAADTDGSDTDGADTDGADTDGAMSDTDGADTDGAMMGTGTGGEEPATIDSDEEAFEALKMLVDAARGGQWNLVVALALMLLVYAAERFGLTEKVPDAYIPWIAAASATLGYVAAALMVEGAPLGEALAEGFVTGAAAVGLGEMVLKKLLSPPKEESEPEEDDRFEKAVSDDEDEDDSEDSEKKSE